MCIRDRIIWKISPKILSAGSPIVNIAANIAAGTFNEGTAALLVYLHELQVKLGPATHEYARREDEIPVAQTNQAAAAQTKEARILRRQKQKDALDIAAAAGTSLYGAGIDDSV